MYDLTAMLGAAVGFELEEFFGNFVEVLREGAYASDVTLCGRDAAFAVLVKCDAKLGANAVMAGVGEFVYDRPYLFAGLVDKAAHTAACVEKDGKFDDRFYLDDGLDGFWFAAHTGACDVSCDGR